MSFSDKLDKILGGGPSQEHTAQPKEYSSLTKDEIQHILNEISYKAKSMEEIKSKIKQMINYSGEIEVGARPSDVCIEFKKTESGDATFFAETKKNLTPEEIPVD